MVVVARPRFGQIALWTALVTLLLAASPTQAQTVQSNGYSSVQLLNSTWIFSKLAASGDPQCVPSGSVCLSAADNATLWSGAGSVTTTQLNSPIVCGSALKTSTGSTGYQEGHWCWQAAAILGSSVIRNDNWCADPVLGTTGLRNRWVYHPARKTYIDCYGLLHPTIVNAVSGGTNVTFTDLAGSVPLRKVMTTDGQGAGYEIDKAMFEIGYSDFTFSFWMLPDPTVGDKQILFADRIYATGSGENFTFVLIHPAEERVSMEILSGSVNEYQVMEVRNQSGFHTLPNLFNSTWKHVAFVRHGSNLTLYVDGKYIASDARVSTSVAHLGGEAAVRMGARGHSNIYDRAPWTPYKGELDDVRLYTRTLNDSEVQLMYERSRDPWTYKLITFQLTNGTYILVELSPDGVDPQCMGTNGVCITGSSPSNLIAAAGSFTGSLADRMRCGSELQNVTGESGYDSGASHWCAQAAVYLKGTTTTRTTSTRSTATTTETHTSSSTTHTSTSLSKTTTSWTHSTTIIPSTTTTLPPQSFSEANFTSIQLLDGTWIFAKLSPNGDPQCIPSGSTCLSAPDNTTLWNNAGSITSSDVGNSIVCGSALKTSSGTTGYQDGHWCWEAAALLNSPVVQNDNFCADPLLGTTGLKHRWVYHPARQTYVDCIGGLHPIIVEAVSGGSNVTYTDIVGSVPLRKAMTTDGLGAGYEVDESMLAIGYSDFTLSFWMLPDATVPDKQLLFTDRIGNTASGENFTFLLIHPAEERVSMEILSGSLSEYQIVEVRNYSSGYHTSPNLFNSTWKHVSFVRVQNNFSLYVDGKYIASDVRASTSVAHLGGVTTVRMGARGHPPINNQSPYTPYKGQMDDMRLYTRALNDSEIAFMFERSRDPWTYKMVTLQLANGTFMFVELSPDGVDPQCLGTNGVCVTGSSESDLIAAAGLFTGSLTDRVRCGSELQNVTGETGYDSGSSHWCAQAAVYLKGTTTTFTTTSLTSSTTTFTETSTSETETTSSLTETSTSETLTSSTVTHTSTSETETTSSLTHTSTSGTETSSSHTRTSTSESETTSSLSRTSTSETERSTSESVTSTSETETSSSLSATSTSASESRTTTAAAQPTTTPVVPAGLANYTAIPLLDGTWILATLSDNGDPQCVPSSSAGSTCMSAPDNATLWRSAENITAAQLNNPLVCGSALETTTGTTGYQDGHWCWQAAAVLGSDVVANDNWCSDPLLGTTGLRNRWVYHPARKTFIDCIGGLHPTLVNVVSGGTNVSFTDVAGSIPLRKAMTTDGQGAGFEIDQAMFAIGYADFTFSFWMLPDPTVVDKQLLFSDRLYSTASGENFTFVMVHPAEERVSMELLSGSVSEYQVIEVRNTAGYVPLPNLFNSTWKHVTFVRQQSNLTLFVDGKYIAHDSRPATSVANLGGVTSVRMAARGHPNIYDRSPYVPYKGKLDDVRLYTRTLNDTEIALLFERSKQPWTYQLVPLQLSNGSFIFVELSPDGVDPQCLGTNGVCVTGSSESDLIAAAGLFSGSLTDRVRCGSELQNVTGQTGYDSGASHWCAQAAVELKGTTTTQSATSSITTTTLTISLSTTSSETRTPTPSTTQRATTQTPSTLMTVPAGATTTAVTAGASTTQGAAAITTTVGAAGVSTTPVPTPASSALGATTSTSVGMPGTTGATATGGGSTTPGFVGATTTAGLGDTTTVGTERSTTTILTGGTTALESTSTLGAAAGTTTRVAPASTTTTRPRTTSPSATAATTTRGGAGITTTFGAPGLTTTPGSAPVSTTSVDATSAFVTTEVTAAPSSTEVSTTSGAAGTPTLTTTLGGVRSTTSRKTSTTATSNPSPLACSNAPSVCSACGVTQLYQIGTLAGAQTLSSTEYAFFTASVAGSSTAVLGPLSSGFLPMFVGISSSAGSISKMCFEAASSTPGTLWSTLSSMGVAVKIQTDDANLQSKLQTAFGLQKLSGVACATGASSCVTSAVITSNIPSGNNVVQLGGGMLDLTAPTFDASYLKATGSFTYRITGDISIASTCTDSICSSFDSLLGSAPIKITGTSGSDGFSFTAPLGDVQLSNDFTMTKATFEFNPGTDKQMGIVGEMNIATDDTLKMTSEISAVFEGSKVELNGNMVGIWSPVFENPLVSVGNLVASLPLNPTVRARALSSFPEFVAGADLAIGPQPCFAAQPPRTYSCARWTDAEKLLLANPRQDALNGGAGSTERLVCSKDRSRAYYYDGTKAPCDCRCCQLEPSKPAAKCISGVGQIGIHPSNPESNFFAVPLEKLALSEVTDALVDGAVKLPKGFASASFPGSVMFSSSSTERRARGLNLLKGTTMGGRMDFLGTEGDAVITIDGATKGFVLDAAAAEPLAVGDVLLLSRSQGNPSAGPSFRIDARGSKVSSPSVSGTGWMSLFSKQAAGPATIAMSSTDELHVTANSQMWGIGASVNVSGWLRQDWTTMPIGASINLSKPDVAAKFSSLVVAKLRELGKRRQFQLTAAQAAVRNKAGQLKAVLKTCNFKACTVPTAERRCLQWMEKRTCPALKVCGQEDPRCIAYNAWAANCPSEAIKVVPVCTRWGMIMTAPLSAACASKCIPPSSAVAQLQNARTALASLESESGAKKFSDYIARAKDPLVLESIVAGLDLRVDGTRAASGRIPVRMDGRAFGKPFSTTFMLDLKDLEQSANRFFASRVVPAIKGRFGRKLVVPVKGRKAEAGSGAFLWGR